MVPGKNWGPVPSPDPIPEDLGVWKADWSDVGHVLSPDPIAEDPRVWKALIGQMWVMCPALTQS